MKLDGKVAVVTGAAGGIGRALARRFAVESARGVVCEYVKREAADHDRWLRGMRRLAREYEERG